MQTYPRVDGPQFRPGQQPKLFSGRRGSHVAPAAVHVQWADGVSQTYPTQQVDAATPQVSPTSPHEPGTTQRPLMQEFPDGHKIPHPPHRIGSVRRFRSQPFLGSRSQSAQPKLHANPQLRVPRVEWQIEIAFGGDDLHESPHAEQFATVPSIVSQPLPAIPSQFAKPAKHVIEHAPAAQTAVAPGPLGQTFPHAPQLLTSERTSRQTSPVIEGQQADVGTHGAVAAPQGEPFGVIVKHAPATMTAGWQHWSSRVAVVPPGGTHGAQTPPTSTSIMLAQQSSDARATSPRPAQHVPVIGSAGLPLQHG